MITGFDPDFDDAAWTLDWLDLPLQQIPPGSYSKNFRVVRKLLDEFDIFGQLYRLDHKLDVRGLYDPSGMLWMSDVPQERMMMYNNAQRTRGHVLVGGAGLGLYPQYCHEATSFTVVERSEVVAELVRPVLEQVMDQRDIPFQFIMADIKEFLRGRRRERYDTIFLDTWSTIDAALLPQVNSLRELAGRHLARGGRVLLWGYGWMLRLFLEASAAVLMTPSDERDAFLQDQLAYAPRAAPLLLPVADAFKGEEVQRWELDAALAECRTWAIDLLEEA